MNSRVFVMLLKIAKYDGIGDTDVRDGLSFIAAHFFLGCEWPIAFATMDSWLD